MTQAVLDQVSKIRSAVDHGRPKDVRKMLDELERQLKDGTATPAARGQRSRPDGHEPTRGPILLRRTMLNGGIEVLDPLDPGLPRTILVNHTWFSQFAGNRERILEHVARELRRG